MANMPFDLETEQEYVDRGLITRREHPELDLRILNYTTDCVIKKAWDDVTLQSRGLIYDLRRRIVARPFRKFFNLEELEGGIPNEGFICTDKADGSLGITYPGPDGKVCIATRGSFTSEQALRGTDFLRRQYPRTNFVPGVTYLFEIVYKENRYVVDYGDFEGLILIGAVSIPTGADISLEHPSFDGFIKAERYPINKLSQVREFVESRPNTEGVVLLFQFSGTRVKVKSSRYLEVFGIVQGWNSRNVWESLSSGSSATSELLKDRSLPEEFLIWLQKTVDDFQTRYNNLWSSANEYFDWRPETQSRKKIAEYFSKFSNPEILFALLDSKPDKARSMIWRLLKP